MKLKQYQSVKRWLAILLAAISLACLIPFAAFSEEYDKDSLEVREVINATAEKLAENVKTPAFGTNAGEWTVLCLARSEYYARCDEYFSDYYGRIEEYVNTQAAKINKNGALHKSKSTDNSRLIIALSAIGRDASAVGDWNLIAPFNDFEWIKKQGINGVIFALIALDTKDYETSDTSIRRQCLDYLLDKQLEDGGWALSGTAFNADITGMTLQALTRYREDPEVAEAAAKAFECLSENQCESGGFKYGGGETSESVAQVIVACAAWGIDPHSNVNFIKNGNSAVDALLEYYVKDEAMFKHFLLAESNDMATDQACYALIAYDRFLNGKTALYDCSDVETIDLIKPLHDYKETVTAPTCVEKGYTTHTCSRCDDTYVDNETEKTGHTAGEWVIEKEAEISVAGSKYKPCAACGEKLETASVDPLPEPNDDGTNDDNTTDTGDTEDKSDTWVTVCIIATALICTMVAYAIFSKRGHKK